MIESDFKQQQKKGNVELVKNKATGKSENQQKPQAKINIEDYINILSALKVPKKFLTSAPTFIPKTFAECFQFYDSGGTRRLYVYVNKVWRYVALT